MAENKFDLADSHGILNDMRDKNPPTLNPEKSNFLNAVRNHTRDRLVSKKLTNKNVFRALVFRNDTAASISSNSRNKAALVAFGIFNQREITVTATIPEMFGHLPLPENDEDHATIDLYPKFSVSVDQIPDARNIQSGDIIKVAFEDVSQLTNPSIVGVTKGGKDSARVDLFGSCPPGNEATPNTRPGRGSENDRIESQPSPNLNQDPCVSPVEKADDIPDPEKDHLGVDFPAAPVSCGPELFENVFGVPPERATAEDQDEFRLLEKAIRGEYPGTLKPGMHPIYYQGRRVGSVKMVAVPMPYATKNYNIILPEERWPPLKQMLDDMYADFWYPRTHRHNRKGFFSKKYAEYDYSKLPGNRPGVPYPVKSSRANKNRAKGFTAGCINSAFRSRPQQAYIRVKNAKINGRVRPSNVSVKEWAKEVAAACKAGQIQGPTRKRSRLEAKIYAQDPADPKGAPSLGGGTKRFESMFDFIMNASSSSSMFKVSTAPPGFSIHQIGAAYDFNGFKVGRNKPGVKGHGPQNNEAGAQMYRWMCRHAIFYGFVRTVSSEEWHWEDMYAPGNDKFTKYRPQNRFKAGFKGYPLNSIAALDRHSEAYRTWADKVRFAFVRGAEKGDNGSTNPKWHDFGLLPLGEYRDTNSRRNSFGADGGYQFTDIPRTYPTVEGMRPNSAESPGTYSRQLSQAERKKIGDEIGKKNLAATRRLKGRGNPSPSLREIEEEAGTRELQDMLKGR